MQGSDGGDGKPMGKHRTAEPPDTTDTAEEDSSAGPWSRQFDGPDGTRSKHAALAHPKYNILTSEATEGGQANTGAAGSEAGHGVTAGQDGMEVEEEVGKISQHVIPALSHNGGEDEARGPP